MDIYIVYSISNRRARRGTDIYAVDFKDLEQQIAPYAHGVIRTSDDYEAVQLYGNPGFLVSGTLDHGIVVVPNVLVRDRSVL